MAFALVAAIAVVGVHVVAGVVAAPGVDVEVAALDPGRIDDVIERRIDLDRLIRDDVTVWRTSSYS